MKKGKITNAKVYLGGIFIGTVIGIRFTEDEHKELKAILKQNNIVLQDKHS